MKINWKLEVPQIVMLGIMALISAAAWSFAPDRVPIHWNLQGEVDGHAGKTFGLLLTPAIATGLYLLLLFIPRIDPGRANLENSAKAYNALRLAMMVFLTAVHAVCAYAALGGRVSMNLFMGLAVGALFIVIGNYMSKLRPNWIAGVRTPWTLSSQLSWTKTHRAAGPVFMGMGLGMIILGLVPRGWMLAIVLSLDTVAIIGLLVYSYIVWRDDPNRISPAGVTAANGAAETENAKSP